MARIPGGDPDKAPIPGSIEGSRDPQVLLLVYHGIRDGLTTTRTWRRTLAEAFMARCEQDGIEGAVSWPRYPFFPIAAFVWPVTRRAKINEFRRHYVMLRLAFPDARFVFAGHSNGTYLAAQALKECPPIAFDRTFFAGCVLSEAYPWERYRTQLGRVRHDRASRDVAVGLGARALELLDGELGAGGVLGFKQEPQHSFLLHGGHAAALQPGNLSTVAAFLADRNLAETLEPGVVAPLTQGGNPGYLFTRLIHVAKLSGPMWILSVFAAWGLGFHLAAVVLILAFAFLAAASLIV
jgi:pimeloyl-ACP methyl ester carboxylesterase